MRSSLVPALLLLAARLALAEEPASMDRRVDALLGADIPVSREASCHLATAGKAGMAALEARLAAMKERTPAQDEAAASALAVALLHSVKREDLEGWPTLAALAKPRIEQGKALCNLIAKGEGKFRSRGLGPDPFGDMEAARRLPDSADDLLWWLQGFALEGLEELSRSDVASNRAWAGLRLIELGAVTEEAVIRRLAADGGAVETFDGCCEHHTSVSEMVSRRDREAQERRERTGEGSVALAIERVVESVREFWFGRRPLDTGLINDLRQSGNPIAWKATTVEEYWTAALPAWKAWWTAAGGSEKGKADWVQRYEELTAR